MDDGADARGPSSTGVEDFFLSCAQEFTRQIKAVAKAFFQVAQMYPQGLYFAH